MRPNGLQKSIIKYEERQYLYDIEFLIDCNTHILSEIDDISHDATESNRMVQISKERNINYLCATPHYYFDREDIDTFLKRRAKSFESLDDIKDIYLGAEVRYFDGISNFKRLKDLCIGHSDYILIEMPYAKWTEDQIDEILCVIGLGYTPIIAHCEDYFQYRNKRNIAYLQSNGCIMQASSEYFYSKLTKKAALKLFNKGYIDILASNCNREGTKRQTLPEALIVLIQNSKENYLYSMLNKYELICEHIIQ